MAKLFISYRRDDSASATLLISTRLAQHFGKGNVFQDIENIPLGVDFRRVVDDTVGQCDAMLVVIGRSWVTITDATGRRRLENPADVVRLEVEAALKRGIAVVPLLVEGARMPSAQDLPASLSELAYRNGMDIRSDMHFQADMAQLIERLTAFLAPTGTASSPLVAPAPFTPDIELPRALVRLGVTALRKEMVDYFLPPLCLVPAGEFLMGSDPNKDEQSQNGEYPQHTVNLPEFQIAKIPVTVAEYACYVRDGHAEPSSPGFMPTTWQTQFSERLDHPVVNVTWHNAMDYAAWLADLTGQPWRLPTEAEWEKAARGTDGRLYPWGDQFDPVKASTNEGGGHYVTTPVWGYPAGASPYGVLDMAGNVNEWVSSLWKPYPYRADDGREQVFRTGMRSQRGGSFTSASVFVRTANRNLNDPSYASITCGFRLVCAPPIA